MVKKSEELLPNWQLLWYFSCLLDFKGIILTNPNELLLKKKTVVAKKASSLGFLWYFRFKGKTSTNFSELSPCSAISKKLLQSFNSKGAVVTNPKKLAPKWPVFGGFSNLLDLRERFWQTLKNCSSQWTFLGCFPNLLAVRGIIEDKIAHPWDYLRFKGSWKPLQNTQTNSSSERVTSLNCPNSIALLKWKKRNNNNQILWY